jgi:hypothetical protein
VEKYGRAGQATDDSIIRRMRSACWITKATETHSEYAILIAFPRKNGYANASLTLYLHCLSCLNCLSVKLHKLELRESGSVSTLLCVLSAKLTDL